MSSKEQSGKLFVFAAPSGAGKTTLVHAVVTKHQEDLRFSISYTTRERRSNEANAVDYLFVSEAEFMRLRDAGEMLEYAHVFDNYYGTNRDEVFAQLEQGYDVMLEIDWQGARQIRSNMSDTVCIFILPPSEEVLLQRLTARGQDDAAVIERRMRDARAEISHYREYDYLVVNDDFSHAMEGLRAIIVAQRLRQEHQAGDLQDQLGSLLSKDGPE